MNSASGFYPDCSSLILGRGATYASVAQQVEHRTENPGLRWFNSSREHHKDGSIPSQLAEGRREGISVRLRMIVSRTIICE